MNDGKRRAVRARRWTPLLVIAAALLVAVCGGRAEAAAMGATAPLTWKDLGGRQYGAADVSRARATVFLFSSTQCPVANLYSARMAELARDYQPRGVRFFLVNSNPEDDRAAVARYVKERRLPFPAVKDAGTRLADRLGAQATPEAIILDSRGAARYMGRIDDHQDRTRVTRHDVREALDALLAGRPVPRSRTIPFGCAIFRDRPAHVRAPERAAVTYAREIAPILNRNCVACHRPGEVAPFALTTYPQARLWAKPIQEYTSRRLMPPWKAVPGYGDFHDARVLTEEEIALLARWADSGAPEGDPRDLPPAPQFPSPSAWPLGSPDMVLRPVRPYHLEAEGKDVYRNFVLPIDFKEDRYVAAMDFRPGNRAIVHHIVAYLDPTGQSAKLDGRETEPGYTVPGIGIGIPDPIWGEAWVPGSSRRFLPPNMAVKIPAGAKIVLQVHYHKSGKPEVDHSQMALYFAKGQVEKELRTGLIGTMAIELAPGKARQEVRASLPLPVDVHLWSVFPHMHMLGREMKVMATLPDGTVKPLIWVNDWDFNWQTTYHYREPLALPRGTKLDLVAIYDNSAGNPRQTAQPPRVVRFGEQTTDEMCFTFFGFTIDAEHLSVASTTTAAALSTPAR